MIRATQIARLRSLTGTATLPGAASSRTSRALGLMLQVSPERRPDPLDLTFRADVRCDAIWGYAEEGDAWAEIGRLEPTGDPGRTGASWTSPRRPAAGPDGDLVQLYVDATVPIEEVRRLEAETEVALTVVRKPAAGKDGLYRLRVGGFRRTRIAVATVRTDDGHRLTAHPTRTGHLGSPSTGTWSRSATSTSRGWRRRVDGSGCVGASPRTTRTSRTATLLFKGRNTGLRWEQPLPVVFDGLATAKDNGNRWYPL